MGGLGSRLLACAVVLGLAACVPPARRGGETAPRGPAPQAHLALYRVRAEGAQGRVRARAWLAVDARAGRLAAEVLGPMGGTRAQLDAEPEGVRAWLTEEDVWMESTPDPEAMAAAFGVPLALPDLIAVLRGRRPEGGRTPPAVFRGPGGEPWEATWTFRGEALPDTITFRGPGGKLRLEVLRREPLEAIPPPFEPPARARRLEPRAFRALFLP